MDTPASPADHPVQATSGPSNCKRCSSGLQGSYYLRGTDEILCADCNTMLMAPPRLSGINAFFRACLASSVVVVISSVLTALITYATDMTFALVWIFVSLGIGIAIKKASEDRGTWPFRLLGMFATYCAIGVSYSLLFLFITLWGGDKGKTVGGPLTDFIPTKQLLQASPSPSGSPKLSPSPEPSPKKAAGPSAAPSPEPGEKDNASTAANQSELPPWFKQHPIIGLILATLFLMLVAVAFVLVMPILMMFQSPMEIVIDGIALYYAWKSTARESREIQGPFSLGDASLP